LLRGGSGVVTNFGSIAGTGFAGVVLSLGGTMTNGTPGVTSASISGGTYGVFVAGTPVTIANYGKIVGTATDGIYAASGATMINGSTSDQAALIHGGYYGIVVAGHAGTISNSGSIGGGSAAGVLLRVGGTVTNNAAAHISGATDGLQIIGAGSTVTNAGLIAGATGVLFGTGASGSTVINSGTISGTAGTAVNFIGSNDRLILQPGATFVGAVIAGSSASTLELSGSSSSLAGLGTSFVNFTNIVVDSGAKWILTGSNTLGTSTTLASAGTLIVTGTLHDQGGVSVSGTLQTGGTIARLQLGGSVTLNGGTLIVNPHASFEVGSLGGAQIGRITVDAGSTITGSGTLSGGPLFLNGTVAGKGGLTILGDVSGAGSLIVGSKAKVTAAGALASSITFAAGGQETLALEQPTAVTGTISGFAKSDTIDLQNVVANTLSFAGGKLTVKNGSTIVASLKFAGTYTTASFALNADGHGGSAITSTGLLRAAQHAVASPIMHDHGASSGYTASMLGLAHSHTHLWTTLLPFEHHVQTNV
jgi:hypothetical protein